ncbi:MFS transporter [Actinomycetospora aeridis]|uniref:MFS transporter n=1 Tax=Actinomycetospora aeridis TaxID=3129231 RepID=A0ABU8MYR1_9PSEU
MTRTPASVLALCLACMTLEGYDVIAYGAALPFLLAHPDWGVTTAQAGVLGSLTPVGMLVGAVVVGLLTDRLGRRRLVLISTAIFSIAMLACGLAPGVAVFAVGRLLVGLGVGGVLPSIAALVYEYSASGRHHVNTALAFAGVGVGGALAALVAALFGPDLGFRVVYLVGGGAALVVLPLAMRFLPESLVYLRARGRHDEAAGWAARLGVDAEVAEPPREGSRIGVLFSRRFGATTVMFCLATFASLLVLFGLYTWLPQLMRSAGYELGSALTFLVVLNVGTAVGPLVLGRLADRYGSRVVTAGSFLLAVVGIAVLSQPLPTVLLYVAVVLAGIGTVGTQILINVFIASRYPVDVRATAIGVALSVGRIGGIVGPLYGAFLLTTQLPTAVLFLAFAAPALLGAVVVASIPRAVAPRPETAGAGARRHDLQAQ